MPASSNATLTAVPGIRVGHITDRDGATGCTVVLCPDGTVGGVDVRGGAPGTRETDLLHPAHLVDRVHAVVLSGGSAFGLATADGVMRWLAERGVGWATPAGPVPIVPAAILYDLSIGAPAKPDAAMGYAACEAASDAPVEQGSVGAGTGCRIGAMMGNELATKGGIGSACIDLGDGLLVAALVAVNAAGDVLDEDGRILAGLRAPEGGFADAMSMMRAMAREVRAPAARRASVTRSARVRAAARATSAARRLPARSCASARYTSGRGSVGFNSFASVRARIALHSISSRNSSSRVFGSAS